MKRNARAAWTSFGLLLLWTGALSAQPTFHKFVAVGDSLPAGEEGACVVQRYQIRGASALIAEALGITDFQQPLLGEVPPTNPLTNYPCVGAVVVNNAITVGIVSMEGAPLNPTLPRPYDNLGFNGGPLVRDFVDLKISVPGRSDVDNNAARVLRNVAGSPFAGTSAVEQAASLNPDLVLYWVGNNDLLGAATSGIAVDGVTLTPVADFAAKYTEGLNTIMASGRTIVTFTIPDVHSVPLFSTLPIVLVDPTTRQPVVIDGHFVPLLGSRAFPPDCPVAPCPLPPGTLLNTIRAGLLLQQGIGIPTYAGGRAQIGSGDLATALPDGSLSPPVQGVLLYPDEVALIASRTADINSQITSISAANHTVLVDLNSSFKQIAANGYQIGGLTLTSAFLSGGLFSADGVHPTQIGYAILADEIILRINEATGSQIPQPNIAEAMFTPNVPTFSSAATTPSGFQEDGWMAMMPICPAIEGVQAPPRPVTATRVLSR